MSRGSRRLRGRALALLAGALLVLLPALPAQAHDRLEASSPADGSTVPTAPSAVVLTFNAPAIALGSKVVVTGPDGAVVSEGDAQFVDTAVTQQLAGDLPAGQYRVEWRVTSSDGHPVSGTFAYTASAPAAGSTTASPSGTPSATESSTPSAPGSATPSEAASSPAGPVADPSSSSSGAPAWLVAGGAVVALAVVAAVAAAVLRRR